MELDFLNDCIFFAASAGDVDFGLRIERVGGQPAPSPQRERQVQLLVYSDVTQDAATHGSVIEVRASITTPGEAAVDYRDLIDTVLLLAA